MMSCPCEERIQYILERYRYDARQQNGEYNRQIEMFQKGIRSGAEEIAVLHLFRAGVYWASYDNACDRNPDVRCILDSVSGYVRRDYSDLNNILRLMTDTVREWGVLEEPAQLMRAILRKKSEKTPPLLLANAKNEVEASRKALSRADVVSERMTIWREGIVVQNNPEVVCIADMHEERFTSSE